MLESILIGLVSKIISYMFEQNVLKDKQYINIAGAPSWYMDFSDRDKYIVFNYSKGNISHIDMQKVILKEKMVKDIKEKLHIVLDKNMEDEFYKDYKYILRNYEKDIDIKSFVDQNIKIPYIEYKDYKQEIFLGGYILKSDFSRFLTKHSQELELKLSHKKLDDKVEQMRKKNEN